MAFLTHPMVNTPPDEAKVWRYLDFPKLIDLLETRELFFPQLAKLADALEGDEFEGSLPRATLQEMELEEPRLRELVPGPQGDMVVQMVRSNQGIKLIYVSCWHRNDHESAAMWKLYSGKGGFAIQSTVGRMKQAFAPETDEGVRIGSVSYIDYETHPKPVRHPFALALHKRHSFSYESEVRALVLNPSETPGIPIRVDVGRLIENLFVSPRSEPRLADDLVRKLKERYRLTFSIQRSSLEASPLR